MQSSPGSVRALYSINREIYGKMTHQNFVFKEACKLTLNINQFMAVKVLVLALLLSAIAGALIPKPPKQLGYPEYTLAAYQYFRCDGVESCRSNFPTYGSLSWSPDNKSKFWSNEYWQWKTTTDPKIVIQCKQDFYPVDPYLGICKYINPMDIDWSPQLERFCQGFVAGRFTCAEGTNYFNAWYGQTIECCSGPGEGIDW